jgi:hypothetical protein
MDTQPSLITLASTGSPPGEYLILISGVADANYTITTINGKLRIVRRQFYIPLVMRGPE